MESADTNYPEKDLIKGMSHASSMQSDSEQLLMPHE